MNMTYMKYFADARLVLAFLFAIQASFVNAEQVCETKTIPASAPSERFLVNENGTIIDQSSGLMWLGCVVGLTGEGCSEGAPAELTWAEALTHVPELNQQGGIAGHQDWRLPNVRELASILEQQCFTPAVNASVFKNTPPTQVWTSSPYHFYTHYSWYVDFDNGAMNYDERIRAKGLRLVRNVAGE